MCRQLVVPFGPRSHRVHPQDGLPIGIVHRPTKTEALLPELLQIAMGLKQPATEMRPARPL
jgi:hypothetical protein